MNFYLRAFLLTAGIHAVVLAYRYEGWWSFPLLVIAGVALGLYSASSNKQ